MRGTALGYVDVILPSPAIAQEQKKNKNSSKLMLDRQIDVKALTVTFWPFLSSRPNHNPSEVGSQPFLPWSLAQKPQQGRIRWWALWLVELCKGKTRIQVQKSVFLRQKTIRAGTNGSAQCSGWEQRQGSVTGPLLLTERPLAQ